MQLFMELCPGVVIHLETISGQTWDIPYLKEDFSKGWPHVHARDFARFLALARRGKPRDSWKPPPGMDPKLAEQQFQKTELERSIRYAKETLGSGVRR